MKKAVLCVILSLLLAALPACESASPSSSGAAASESSSAEPESRPPGMQSVSGSRPLEVSSPEQAAFSEAELEEARSVWDALYPGYREICTIFYTGTAFEEVGIERTDEKGNTYVQVKSEKYKTLKDVSDATEKVFTKDFAERKLYRTSPDLAAEGVPPMLKEFDGSLYRLMADAPYTAELEPDTFKVEKFTDSELQFSMEGELAERFLRTFTLVKTDGGWRIDDVKNTDPPQDSPDRKTD